jgi:hypothetical protein
MVCYSEKTKNCCAKFVFSVSLLVFVEGVLSIIFGAIQLTKKTGDFTGFLSYINQGGIGLGILITGAVAISIALCGCATCKWRKPWLAIPYIILALVLGIVMIIIGIVALAITGGPIYDRMMLEVCDGAPGQ